MADKKGCGGTQDKDLVSARFLCSVGHEYVAHRTHGRVNKARGMALGMHGNPILFCRVLWSSHPMMVVDKAISW